MKFLKNTFLIIFILLLINGCKATTTQEAKTIRVGALPTPNAEIIENTEGTLSKMGYSLEISEYSDYESADKALLDGEIDANYVQNLSELESFNQENHSNLISLGSVHYSPQGLYAGQVKNINSLSKNSTILIPSEPIDQARALNLLEKVGLIRLAQPGKDKLLNLEDIVENKKSLDFKEMPANEIARNLNSAGMGVVDGSATRLRMKSPYLKI